MNKLETVDTVDIVTLDKKDYSTRFRLNSKLIAMIYMCYQYKFPLSFLLAFYEMYGDNSLFALKAFACAKKISLNDNTFVKIIEESRILYRQILAGESRILEINSILTHNKNTGDNLELPEYPTINSAGFSDSFRNFIDEYLLVNIDDIFAPIVTLKFRVQDLYSELVP